MIFRVSFGVRDPMLPDPCLRTYILLDYSYHIEIKKTKVEDNIICFIRRNHRTFKTRF